MTLRFLPYLLFAPMRFFPFVPEVLLEMSFVLTYLLTYLLDDALTYYLSIIYPSSSLPT